jgi:hypothetical protein
MSERRHASPTAPPRARADDRRASDDHATRGPVARLVDAGRAQAAAYAGGRRDVPPLGGYVRVMAVYSTVVGAFGLYVRRRGIRLPRRLDPYDVALVALGTHKLSRLLTHDAVTSPLRAPFTRFKGVSGPSELQEEVRGTGVRHAVGDLVTCPFCSSQWIATGFVFGLVLAPRATRLVASTFSALAIADLMQFARSAAQQATEG